MAISKGAKALDRYYDRLKRGKVNKIKRSHVEAVIDKLKGRKRALQKEAEETRKDSKKSRLKAKIGIAREQIKRAKALLKEIDSEAG